MLLPSFSFSIQITKNHVKYQQPWKSVKKSKNIALCLNIFFRLRRINLSILGEFDSVSWYCAFWKSCGFKRERERERERGHVRWGVRLGKSRKKLWFQKVQYETAIFFFKMEHWVNKLIWGVRTFKRIWERERERSILGEVLGLASPAKSLVNSNIDFLTLIYVQLLGFLCFLYLE